MRLILNIIWFVLCGLWMAIGYTLAALVCFILIITIPFGVASLRIAMFALWPFGKTVVKRARRRRVLRHRQRHLARPVRLVARARTPDHGHRALHHDHRHPAGARELQAHPGLAAPLGREIVPVDQAYLVEGGTAVVAVPARGR